MTTILCVDDYPPFLRLLSETLEIQGYRTLATLDPEHALLMATTGADVDLVVTDFVMPKMSGGELIHEIRRIEAGRFREHLPIILLSGAALLPRYGANTYLSKDDDWQPSLFKHITQLLTQGVPSWHRKVNANLKQSVTRKRLSA